MPLFTSTLVNASPSVTVSITGRSLSNYIATVTTSAPHGFVSGDRVNIQGASLGSPFTGFAYIISVPTSNTFEYRVSDSTSIPFASVSPAATATLMSVAWKNITGMFVNVGGLWKQISNGFVNVGGLWKRFFTSSLTPSIAFQVQISTNSSSFPATLTGTNYRWTDATSLTYIFQKSSDGVNFSDIGFPQTISNPAVGSFNTVTYTLTRADFPAYTSYFRFSVTGTNTTYSTSFTSNSTAVTVNKGAPFNTVAPTISPTSGTAGTTTYSITSNGTWDPDDSDGIYQYQWQAFDSPTYVTAPGASTGSSYTPPANFLTTNFSPIRCRVRATNSVGSTDAFSNTATVSAPAGGGTPTAPLNLRRNGNGNGDTKSFLWDAPSSNGGSAITRYEYDYGIGYFSNGLSTSVTVAFLGSGNQSISVRAVNANGNGTPATLSVTIPLINSGPTSSVSGTSVTISWTNNGFQNSYSLSIPGVSGTPFTGTTQTSRTITGLSNGTYTPTLTITSSAGDTHTVAGNSFTIGGATPPSNVVVTITSAGTSGNDLFIPGDTLTANFTASGSTPFTSTTYAWARSTTSNVSSSYTAVGTNSQTLHTNSTYEERWVRCTVTVQNAAGSASGTSSSYFMSSSGGPI